LNDPARPVAARQRLLQRKSAKNADQGYLAPFWGGRPAPSVIH
jgi:hypothetical protein